MRKLATLTVALVAVFTFASVANAQTTAYTVTGSTKPAKAGSKKKPVPLGLSFGLSAEHGQNRPTTAARFRLEVEGIRTNGRFFKKCTAQQITNAGGDDVCKKGARLGTGVVNNLAGNANDQTDKSITCNLSVTLYNGGQNRVALFLEGGPSGFAQTCVLPISTAIDARWIKVRKSLALQFDIPSNLQSPVPGVLNAISRIDTNIPRKTTKRRGKRVGYIEGIGCRGGSRDVVLTTTSAQGGGTLTGRTTSRC